MGTFGLIPHPDAQPAGVRGIEARVTAIGPHWLTLRWVVSGAAGIDWPKLAGRRRADGLWKATCFEAFVQPEGGEHYVELNLSPSESWAAYDFAGYRAGMADRPMPRSPDCTLRRGSDVAIFDAAVPIGGLPRLPWRLGLSAVVEEEGGVLSYWALSHPEGRPDFHNAACFAARVAAADTA